MTFKETAENAWLYQQQKHPVNKTSYWLQRWGFTIAVFYLLGGPFIKTDI